MATDFRDDKYGFWMVLWPVIMAFAQFLVVIIGLEPRSLINGGIALLMIVGSFMIASQDATQRGKSVSSLVLLFWIVGYPLHMRERTRYSGNYFGLGSAFGVMGFWFVLTFVAGVIHVLITATTIRP